MTQNVQTVFRAVNLPKDLAEKLKLAPDSHHIKSEEFACQKLARITLQTVTNGDVGLKQFFDAMVAQRDVEHDRIFWKVPLLETVDAYVAHAALASNTTFNHALSALLTAALQVEEERKKAAQARSNAFRVGPVINM